MASRVWWRPTVTLRCSPVSFVAPGHCTGTEAKQSVFASFGHRYHPICVGMEMHIDENGRLEHLDASA